MYRPDYKLSVVVPAYNEEAVLDLFYQKMTEVLKGFGCDYELIFVDDGSADATWAKLAALSEADAAWSRCVLRAILGIKPLLPPVWTQPRATLWWSSTPTCRTRPK